MDATTKQVVATFVILDYNIKAVASNTSVDVKLNTAQYTNPSKVFNF
jgi:hypothetical protein